VIDWKSDVDFDPAVAEHYRAQVGCYLDLTGVSSGLIVFVTSGRIVTVTR
jgi:exodeoxyribonuclease-5